MTFIEAIQSAFSKYAEFNGRARRSELWWFLLFNLLVGLAAGVIDAVLRTPVLGALVSLGFLLPGLAVQVRRLHDLGKSGWWLLLSFIPIVGFIILIVWWCRDGEVGGNRFGADPKRRDAGFGAATLARPSPPV